MSNVNGTEKPRKHGEIIGFYVVVWDHHIGRQIIVPATLADVRRGAIQLP